MDSNPDNKTVGSVLVIGGGIAGIQASLDLADSGYKVYLLESLPAIGGVMPTLDKTFPTNDCSMCILAPKLVEAGRHPNIELLTYCEFESLDGQAGHFSVRVKRKPRFVDAKKCTGCALCIKVDVPDFTKLVEHDGELWDERIVIDAVKCVQCGDCQRACAKENPDAPAMSSIREDQAQLPTPSMSVARGNAGAELKKVRAMNQEQRRQYWNYHMAKCMKCYGCRDVCPVFVPSECKMEEWAQPGFLPPDPPLYHLARAYYISQRCTWCGFCEETCPSNLPLRTLVDLIRHEHPDNLFAFVPGLAEEQIAKIRTSFPVRERQEEPA